MVESGGTDVEDLVGVTQAQGRRTRKDKTPMVESRGTNVEDLVGLAQVQKPRTRKRKTPMVESGGNDVEDLVGMAQALKRRTWKGKQPMVESRGTDVEDVVGMAQVQGTRIRKRKKPLVESMESGGTNVDVEDLVGVAQVQGRRTRKSKTPMMDGGGMVSESPPSLHHELYANSQESDDEINVGYENADLQNKSAFLVLNEENANLQVSTESDHVHEDVQANNENANQVLLVVEEPVQESNGNQLHLPQK
ncbi:uncharacterized protein LOC132058524 [Lycium ferocissimum]|uniref:uncharacterized protein LOC132058524 n=1 Tax=Lycium ferocissimum TaxID=112874 RepID=UPI0028159E0D|nr:uncharacterized protein LOC132058524 [Lycium ferocissimum]